MAGLETGAKRTVVLRNLKGGTSSGRNSQIKPDVLRDPILVEQSRKSADGFIQRSSGRSGAKEGNGKILSLLGILIVLEPLSDIVWFNGFYRQPGIPPATLAAMGSLTPGTTTPGTALLTLLLRNIRKPGRTSASVPHGTAQYTRPTETPGPVKGSVAHRVLFL